MTRSLPLYSDSFPEDAAALARGMADGGCDGMATKVFAYEEESENAGRWIEAWKDPRTSLWTVERHRCAVSAAGGDVRSQETVLKNVSFFDAAGCCAQFEARESGDGARRAVRAVPGLAHFRDAAEAALIPFDTDGMPHPAAFGRILTGGEFDACARDLAAKTKGREAVAVDVADQGAALGRGLMELPADKAPGRGLVPVAPPQARSLAEIEGSLFFRNTLREAFKAAGLTEYTLRRAIYRDFSGAGLFFSPDDSESAWPMIATFFSIGTFYPAYCAYRSYWGATDDVSAWRAFSREKKRLDKLTRKLPDGPEKTMFSQFSAAAGTAYLLEEASFIYRQCKQGYLPPRKLKTGLKLIGKAARLSGEGADTAEKMQAAYAEGKFPGEGYFLGKLEEQLSRMKSASAPLLR